jgi:peroxin-16
VNLLALYHDVVVAKHAVAPPATLHNRFTGHLCKDATYRRLAYATTVLKMLEVCGEMGVRKLFGDAAKWRFILSLESIKCVICFYFLLIYLPCRFE